MQRSYTDEELEEIDPPPFAFEGKTYTQYEVTQKQRQIERTIRRLKRERAAELKEEETAVSARIRWLDEEYKAFSQAGLDDFISLPQGQIEQYKEIFHQVEILLGVESNDLVAMHVEARKSPLTHLS